MLKIKPHLGIAKDSLGIVALGIVNDVTFLLKSRPTVQVGSSIYN